MVPLAEPTDSRPTSTRALGAVGLGGALVLFGLAANPTSLGWTFAEDGHVAGSLARTAILALDALLVLIGLALVLLRPRLATARLVALPTIGLLALAAYGARQTSFARSSEREVEEKRAILSVSLSITTMAEKASARIGPMRNHPRDQ